MSGKLALSSVVSVLLMAGYALFSGDARPLAPETQGGMLSAIEAPAAQPQASALLPR